MRFAAPHMPAATEYAAVADDHATHPRIRGRAVESPLREFHRTAQEQAIDVAGHNPSSSTLSRAISSENSLMSWKSRYTEAKRT